MNSIYGIFMILFCTIVTAQNVSGVSINWNVEVGCQEYTQDFREPDKPIFIETIPDDLCIHVCERSTVTYTLSGNMGNSPATQWIVTGGVITSHNDETCTVLWGEMGEGSVGFSIATINGINTKNLCIQKVKTPTANFNIVGTGSGFVDEDMGQLVYYACINQALNFVNTSTSNPESVLTSSWSFSDGSTSGDINPTHVYTEEGTYTVYLKVTNECGCSNTKKILVIIKNDGFTIQCPSVVCENQTVVYSLPFNAQKLCEDNYNWSTLNNHGTVIDVNPDNGSATVIWNHMDDTGFGYLTFTPEQCDLDCLLPTTIKVPVILNEGTITGSTTLCQGEQSTYSLPQWPTTDFQWQIVSGPNQDLIHIIQTDQLNQVVVLAEASGTYVLRATYENTLLHCGGTAEITITVGKSNGITGPTTLCKGETATYSTNNGGEYDWVIKKNSTVVATGLASSSIDYNFHNAGNYTVGISSTELCTTTTLGVTVYELPQIPGVVNGETLVCPNAPYNYVINSPDPTANYIWEVLPAGSGTFIGSHEGPNVNIQFDNLATHQIAIRKESQSPIQCLSVPKIININTQQINAQIALDGTTQSNSICANTQGQYKVIIPGTNLLYEEGETYIWSITSGGTNPPIGMPASSVGSILSGQGLKNITILWNNVLQTTTVNVHLEIRKCTLPLKLLDFIVTVVPQPTLTINVQHTSICSSANNVFSLTSNVAIDPLTPVTWNFGGETINSTFGANINHPFVSSFSTNITRIVTATINASSATCGVTTTAIPVELTIYPGPAATNSVFSGDISFCDESEINTVLIAATTSGSTIQWYSYAIPTSILLVGETNGTYHPTQYGNYYFVATNPLSNCSKPSNIVSIYQCPPSLGCDVGVQNIENNAEAECVGRIVLNGYAPTSLAPLFWNIYGPYTSYSNYTEPYIVGPAGVYHTQCIGTYPCPDGNGFGFASVSKDVIIPYTPMFAYTKVCNGNSNFTVSVFDNSNFYNPVENHTYAYYLDSGNGYPATPNLTSGNGLLALNLGAGTYHIKLVIQGTLNGVLLPACEKEMLLKLETLPANMSIDIVNLPVSCHDTAVGFEIFNISGLGNTYLWNFDQGAQNTLSTPSRVFNQSGSQDVSVQVTNKDGCQVVLNVPSPGVFIPAKCFSGVLSAPVPTIACSGNPITLTYTPGITDCNVQEYVWMKGNAPIVPVVNSNTISVYDNGFYWLKVKSATNCVFDTPNRIVPLFEISPNLTLQVGSSSCEGDTVLATLDTDASIIKWYIDTVPMSEFDNSISAYFPSLTLGTHTIKVVVFNSHNCSRESIQTIEVFPKPGLPELTSSLINCNPYEVKLVASGGDGNYTWSNGSSGESTIVTQGGVYFVKSTIGGCSSMKTITVPKNLQNFSWVLPSGCESNCGKDGEEGIGNLIGPNIVLSHWEWLFNENVISSGDDSIPQPLNLSNSGSYNFSYTNSFDCTYTCTPFDYTIKNCDACNVSDIHDRSIDVNGTKYCSYSVTLSITNTNGIATIATLSSPNDAVVIQPATFMLNQGTNDYVFTFVPINGFAGGNVNLSLTSTIDGLPCINTFEINLPECGDVISKNQSIDSINSSLLLYPNPTKHSVTLTYNECSSSSLIEIYDMTGRLIMDYKPEMTSGNMELSLDNFVSGIYIVVLKDNNQIILQKKLIKE